MQILFIDESGNPPSGNNFFVLGGVVIPEEIWSDASHLISSIKQQKNIRGEIKWRWIFNKKDNQNPLQNLSIETRLSEIVIPILEFIEKRKLVLFTVISHINEIKPSFSASKEIEENSPLFNRKFDHYCYHMSYEHIVQRFEYYLQDCYNNKISHKGIVICDGRNNDDDRALQDLHKEMLEGKKHSTKYYNLIEHVLISPSHFSVGIQFADIVSGVISNKVKKIEKTIHLFEYIKNNFCKRRSGQKETPKGRGIVLLPTKSTFWNKK